MAPPDAPFPPAVRASVPTTLAQLAEIQAIGDVLHEYCEAVDEQRLDDIAGCFTPGCRFDRGHGIVYVGRAALRAFLAASLGRYRSSSHHLSNVRIRLDGADGAGVSSYVHAYHWYAGSDTTSELWARYRDQLVKRDGRWLIAARWIRAAGERDIPTNGRPTAFEPLPRQQAGDR